MNQNSLAMTSLIKNLHLLTDIVKPADIVKMEHAALEHRRYGSITFKIVDLSDTKVTFQAVQGRSSAAVYHTKKRLIEIVNETFGRFFTGRKILVHPVPYQDPSPNQVNAQWINKQMLESEVKLKDIAAETGINYTQLSAAISEDALSQPMKALFWFYFLSKR